MKEVYSAFPDTMSDREKEDWKRWKYETEGWANQYPKLIYVKGASYKKQVCLTFDDAPDKKNTPLILDILNQYNVKASFFVLGRRIIRYPEMVLRMDEEGHYVGCHTYTHPDLTKVNLKEIEKEIESSSGLIKRIIGKTPVIFRPPYGKLNNRVVEVLSERDIKAALWSINTYDWLERKPENIIGGIMNHAKSGDIILLHSYVGKEPTVKALPGIICTLRQKGYELVTIDELLSIPGYI